MRPYRIWDIEAKKMRDIITRLVFDISGKVVKCCYCDDNLAEVPLANYGHRKNGKDTFILMQSTGLKDKNGEEMFEGDKFEVIYTDVPNGFAVMGRERDIRKVTGVVVYKWSGFYLEH